MLHFVFLKNVAVFCFSLQLACDVKLDPRPEYHRCSLVWNHAASENGLVYDGIPLARSTGNQISSRLLSLAAANALVVLPAYTEACPVISAGSLVDAIIIGPI